DGRALVMHFGMSGVVRVETPAARRKHEHVWIRLDDGRAFKFEDPRRFGILEIQPLGPDGWPVSLAAFGVEPLSSAFTGEFLFNASRGKKRPVKELLMDNTVVTGLGNIYTAETLFAAQVRPARRAARLTRAECAALVANAKRILRAAIALGGTTVSDFLNVDGSEGRFAQKLLAYGHAGRPCPVCGAAIRNVTLGGRSSCYCPKCQK
ncbi:MAG TPA: bifunctional DNA-formamidopyrimidine glycosylase/DNA-(apurinic or apyrimidinic site) lyase, partial [Opitutales bacterium]|nr:bifunctional DNA-formamidopyrimidine glycosylase/DNA-(apurinic or apyrimidinic site) lyase [Opitutales bacterium]